MFKKQKSITSRLIEQEIDSLIHEAQEEENYKCFSYDREYEKQYLKAFHIRIAEITRFIKEAIDLTMQEHQKEGHSNYECKMLDIGSSPFTILYNNILNICVKAVAIHNNLEDRFRKHGIMLKMCDMRSEKIPFESNTFDIVVFTALLEHLPGPFKPVFDEIRRVTKPAGYLVLSTPNIARLSNRMKLLFGWPILRPVNLVYGEHICDKNDREKLPPYGHIREFTMNETLDLVELYGYKQIKKKQIIHGYRSDNIFRDILALLMHLLQPFSSYLGLLNVNLILARKID